jgi:predicted protein tyrosine phosphatase
MEILVYSRRALEAAQPHDVPHIIISITSVATDRATLRLNEHTLGVLRLAFPDYDTPTLAFPESELFSEPQARSIWELVLAHRSSTKRIVVHCEAGISRSSAVAAALRHVLGGGDEAEFFSGRYLPNPRVYRMLLAAAPTVTFPVGP